MLRSPRPLRSDGICRLCLFTLFTLLLMWPSDLFAGQGRAPGVPLNGIVRDTTGLVLPGATVELSLAGATLTRSTVSAADGTFVFLDVRVGSYHLHVTFPGFDPIDQTLTVDTNAHPPQTVVMRPRPSIVNSTSRLFIGAHWCDRSQKE